MSGRKKGGGGSPGNDLAHPGSPRYNAELYGIAVRLPKDRVDLALAIVRGRAEAALRDGKGRPLKLSEVLRHVFDLGMYELQIREAIASMTRRHRILTLKETADHVRLPEALLRRELAARGIQMPTATEDETPWPIPFESLRLRAADAAPSAPHEPSAMPDPTVRDPPSA